MNIALIAHDKKKELLIQFCIAYCGILNQHSLCATATTGRLVAESTGLDIFCFMAGRSGGTQQIGARIAYNEIDLVIFFRDPLADDSLQADVENIIKLCDTNNIPIATNVATAEVLIQGLQRGDFEWRDIVNPKKKRETL
ncbi:MAG: methylglyoxal synthase [Bacillota bacterium]|nr:methylglyoxal synthase [Bacillota bacterium]